MAELDKEIAELKARVSKYETELDAATTAEEKQRISGLINSRTETLNRLLDEKKAQTSATDEKSSKLSVTELVALACKLHVSEVNPNAVSRMVRKFGWSVDIAIRTNDTELLAGAYEDALKLPSVHTTVELERNGFVLDGVLINGNDNLQICFKRSVPHVLKICTPLEYERAKNFENVLKGQPPCQWIISFELYERHFKFFMFMPLHPVTLEHLPSVDLITAPVFWTCLSGALDFLHQNGYAHNDVKPPNILINTCGEFILTDLGSLVLFHSRSASTRAYIPRELWDRRNDRGPVASINADFWMLAMTIFEKVCGGDISGAESPKQATIIEAVKANTKCDGFCHVLLDRLGVLQYV